MGASDVNDFVQQGGNINQTMMPDAMVTAEADKGNLVPIDAM